MNLENYRQNQYLPPRPFFSGFGNQGPPPNYIPPSFGVPVPHGYCPSNPEYMESIPHRPPPPNIRHGPGPVGVIRHNNNEDNEYLYPNPPRPFYGISQVNQEYIHYRPPTFVSTRIGKIREVEPKKPNRLIDYI